MYVIGALDLYDIAHPSVRYTGGSVALTVALARLSCIPQL